MAPRRRSSPTSSPATPAPSSSRSTRPDVEAVALQDRVLALVLIDPTKADEAGDRLVDTLARGTDHPGQLFLSDRKDEVVDTFRQLEQSLRRSAGDVEEHAVGQRLVGDTQALGEEARDTPQQSRVAAERVHDRFERNRQYRRWLQRPSHRRPRTSVEHRHLAEQIPRLHQRDHCLAMVDGIGDGDGEPAAQDEVQRVGDVALVEQDVPSDQVLLVTGSGDGGEHIEWGLGEEFGLRKKIFVSHARRTVLPSPVVPLAAAEIVWTIVVAGGSGSRTGCAKQYELVGSRRVIDHAAETARAVSDGVVLVVPEADVVSEGGVPGGATRSESVRAGLDAVPVDATIICVHDAARPFASQQLFTTVIAAVADGADGAVPGVAVADTIKRIDADGRVVDTPPRAMLVAVQTPQAFRADVLRAAHARGDSATDDAALVEELGGRVVVVAGEAANRKITDRDDLVWARDTAVRDGI